MISNRLNHQIEVFSEALLQHPLMLAARSGSVTPQVVAKYLSSIHYLVQHTPPHLALACESARRAALPALARFYSEKLSEEVGHDEWAEEDLALLSARFQFEAKVLPSPAIVGLVRDLEALIERDPTAYLAYILFSEYLTVLVGPLWVSTLQERCGVPAAALSVISRHAEADREHVSEGRRFIDALAPATAEPRLVAAVDSAISRIVAFCDELELELRERAA